jgi:lipid II:glycine glycyltransferase (peptidoglycan interpeptide bridge formation enzyme)
VIKVERCPPDVSFEEIEKVAQKHKALVVKIEVDIRAGEVGYARLEKEFRRYGYVNSRFVFCPTKTVYVDLTKSTEDLLAGFDRDVRRHLKGNNAKVIKVERQTSLEDFYALLARAGKERHFVVQKHQDWRDRWGVWSKRAVVVLASKNGELLGGNFSLLIPPTAYGIFLPLTAAGRQAGAAYPLLWEGFKMAKERGCHLFDLEGVYDARYGQPQEWRGLTAFKRKFRGQEKEFLPAKVKVRSWYLKPWAWTGVL